jgi:hypothetical protein
MRRSLKLLGATQGCLCTRELIAGAGEATQPQALEAVMCLQVREAHLNPLPLVARPGEGLGLHLSPRDITSVFMQVTGDLTCIGCGAALRSKRAGIAVALRSAIEQCAPVMHGAGRLSLPAGRI